jgi:hypothetical protein
VSVFGSRKIENGCNLVEDESGNSSNKSESILRLIRY